MKKFLLSIAAMIAATGVAMANEHTLVFDGENDMYGLKRQTTTQVNSMEFVKDFSFTEAGIDFSITADGTGNGYALVNAGGTNAGLYISSHVNTKMDLTVPGGTITSVKLYMTGYALMALSIDFNGKTVDSDTEGSLYFWTWSNAEGTEKVSMEWPLTYMARYIHSIEVSYTEDLGEKKECGLQFSESTAEAIMGKEFTLPTLSNPNNLPLEWSSSDETVATVSAKGEVTLLKGGKTVITVSTEGNDEFAAGNAKYTLSVVPVATNLVQMKEVAPENYDRVMVEFPMTVTFANGSYAFVIDSEGNAACMEDTRNEGSSQSVLPTIYKVGDIIPAGWIATNSTVYKSIIWRGLPSEVTETTEVTYPEVKSISPADVDRVVTLMNVTFEKSTASETSKSYGTTPDGTRYEFQDNYGAPLMPPGTYDVTGVVKYSEIGTTVYFYMAPIAYAESKPEDPDPGPGGVEGVKADDAQPRYFNLQGVETANPTGGVYVKVTAGKAEKVLVK